jgi:hypothetical protein
MVKIPVFRWGEPHESLEPIPTIKLDWLQPHEGNIVDFLFRARAFQMTPERLNA